MLSNFDLNHLLNFPIKEVEARKQFLIGTLVYLAAFIIPIIPMLLATGYMVRIMHQVLRNEQPHMADWDDWGEMLTDGARLFGARLVYMLPMILILLIPFFVFTLAIPLTIEGNNSAGGELMVMLFVLFSGGFMLIFFVITLAAGILLPAAELHLVSKDEFTAAFQIREWWQIFQANWAGFLLAFVIAYAVNFILAIVMQFFMLTLVLICILPFIMPAIMMYYSVVMHTAFAQAYREGQERVQAKHTETA